MFKKALNKKRLRNAAMWSALGGMVLAALQLFGIQVAPDAWTNFVNSLIVLLIGLGILSNPTTSNTGFSDDGDNVEG